MYRSEKGGTSQFLCGGSKMTLRLIDIALLGVWYLERLVPCAPTNLLSIASIEIQIPSKPRFCEYQRVILREEKVSAHKLIGSLLLGS